MQKTQGIVRNAIKKHWDQLGRSDLLLNVTHDLSVCKNLDEALEKLVAFLISRIGAERGTIFLNDSDTGELYSRVAQGHMRREIRLLNNSGIAGWVFTHTKPILIKDAYKDPRFNRSIDERTGFATHSILCAPLRTVSGVILGVSELLNKREGEFTEEDLEVMEAVTKQASIVLERHLVVEQINASRKQELEFLSVVTQLSAEVKLGPLLQKIISTITKMLDAERSTLFINDEKTNELYTEIADGLGTRIRFPNHLGISGTVFTTGQPIMIPHAYADLRFNPSFDKQTGFFTRSILCMPVMNKMGKTIGVTQVLNKRGGVFTKEDEARLAAFTSQIAIAIENAKLFDDIQNMKNYNESILESMSNGVITANEDEKIVTCNAAGLRILKIQLQDVLGKPLKGFFTDKNSWLYEKIDQVSQSGKSDVMMDADLECQGESRSVNITILPLINVQQKKIGTMIMLEDISKEKRMKSTMSRYMDADLAEKLMKGGEEILGGTGSVATVLFSDIRSFTTLTEELGPQGTVSLLNEYFTIMVDCIQKEGGMLDKFIGDAIMAVFGTPFPHEDDVDRSVRAAVAMMQDLNRFNAVRQEQGKKPINIGIGLNTDMIVSGNIGSPRRMDYTVIGDGVNLASRLESACKQYGARILISEFTFKALKATYRTREVDKVIVKGKTKPVGIYEVMDYYTDLTFPNLIEVLEHFKNGVDYYKKGKWDMGIKSFSQALQLNPNDTVSTMYIERCEQLKTHPPEGEWDGVWVLKSK